jgi:hypothetical protein
MTDRPRSWTRFSGPAGPVWLEVELDPAEHRRRADSGLGALTRRTETDVLSGLPVGMAVAQGALSPWELQVLTRLPAGHASPHPDGWTRWAITPLRPIQAVAVARSWSRALKAVSAFAGFCQRAVVLHPSALTTERDRVLVEAIGYGVGVMSDDEELVAAAPFAQQRFTPAGWWFAERVYRTLLIPQRSAAGPTPEGRRGFHRSAELLAEDLVSNHRFPSA